MATGYTAISLTDGTNTTNLNDTTNYVLQGGGWSPRVARRMSSTIGNRCPYEDVVEEITISVIASTPSGAILKLTYITDLLETAKKYINQENIDPVTITVEPQGVASGAWSALVLDGEVILPNNWADLAPTNNIENVTLRIIRRGIWTRAEYTSTTSSATDMGKKGSVTLTSPGFQGYASEVLITQSADERSSSSWWNHPGYIVVTSQSNRASWLAGSAGTADSANKPAANATNISTFDDSPPVTIDITGANPTFATTAKRVAILGTFKTTNTAIPVTCELFDASLDLQMGVNKFLIPDNADEDVVLLGVFNWSASVRYIQLVATAAATITFDMLWLVDVSDPGTALVKAPNLDSYATTGPIRTYRIYNPSTAVGPVFQGKVNAGTYVDLPISGDAWIPVNAGTMYVGRIARGDGNYWQPVTSGLAVITTTYQVKAYESSLIPR